MRSLAVLVFLIGCGGGGGGGDDAPPPPPPPGDGELVVEQPVGELAPGRAVVLRVVDDTIPSAPTATLAGGDLRLVWIDETHLGFVVPELPPGPAALAVAGFADLELAISAVPAIADPAQHIADELATLDSAVMTEQAGASAATQAYYDDARSAITRANAAIAAASPADQLAAARLLAANAEIVGLAALAWDDWNANAVGFVIDWGYVGVAVVITASSVATGNVLGVAVGGAMLLVAYSRLAGRHERTREQIFVNRDSIHAELAPAFEVLEGHPRVLPITAEFRAVTAADIDSPNATVRDVAGVLAAYETVYAKIDALIDGPTTPPLDTGPATSRRPFRNGEITVTSDRLDIVLALGSDAEQPATISADPGTACAGLDHLPVVATIKWNAVPDAPVEKPFEVAVRCKSVTRQSVVSRLEMPTSNQMAREYGVDVDGDGVVDNALGMVVATLAAQIPRCVTQTVSDGSSALVLHHLELYGLDEPRASRLRTYEGTRPAGYVAGTQLLDGQSGLLEWRSTETFAAGTVELPFLTGVTTALARGVAVKGLAGTEDGLAGNLGGALDEGQISQLIAREHACVAQDPDETSLALFDTDKDGAISLSEYQTNSLIMALHAPDVTIDGVPALSFGMRFATSAASFTVP